MSYAMPTQSLRNSNLVFTETSLCILLLSVITNNSCNAQPWNATQLFTFLPNLMPPLSIFAACKPTTTKEWMGIRTKMSFKVTKSLEINSAPEKLWTTLRIFGGNEKFNPLVTSSRVEGHGVGSKRVCYVTLVTTLDT